MIKSVVRQYNWSPEIVGKLKLDDLDYKGLLYWYNDCKEIEKQIEEAKTKK